MSMKYEDLQSLESEKKSQGSRNGLPPPPAFLQHVCSGPWPLLLSLGLILLLMIGICVIGSKTRSLNDKVFSLESKLEKEQQELKAGYSDMLKEVQQLVKGLNSLNCQMAALKSNDSQNTCCPINWLKHEGSCYWFSGTGKPWPEAERYCQLQNAHLVVINSREEQIFVQKHIGSSYTWMGLSDPEGAWKWVDGTNYETNFNSDSLRVGPRMSMKYEDLQSLESEKKSQGSRKGLPPPPAFLQHLCSGPWPLLLSLGLILLLMIGICVIGSKTRSLNDTVFSLESKLEREQQELKADYSEVFQGVQQLVKGLNTLHCQLVALKSNDSQNTCCPIGWLEYEGSCYWFSRSGLTWPQAEKYCQLQNAHLVVINSREEQRFIAQHSSSFYTWIGLTESDGSWKWVDGTDYGNSYKNWAIGEPNNWQGHGEGRNEDCAEVVPGGRWNDDFCLNMQRWACEMTRNITG
ncbi:Asialoglycoprotein receptor 2 [Myotis davidii]|uniref:Asialoglycoprotein receptor 2 n=1 Tax=Myotis davidii TaxID=225400 RepID=L5LGE7_MYODS|nr:Asialoglycoprotein receptor 2 [Myotis davidii]